MNMYVPYEGKQYFWDSLFSFYPIREVRWTLGGDLNVIVNIKEVWEKFDMVDRFDNYCIHNIHNIEASRPVDIESISLSPMWSNKGVG
jgi:hypothetical protein